MSSDHRCTILVNMMTRESLLGRMRRYAGGLKNDEEPGGKASSLMLPQPSRAMCRFDRGGSGTDSGDVILCRGPIRRAAAASPPLSLPSTSYKTNVPEAKMSPRKRVCFTTPAPGCEIGESSAAGAARQLGPTLEADT
ncbi:hypothetical protein Tco_0167306 [Tanacetum coccineum]